MYALGRGEAVLNWGHQKIVNSALWNQYGTTLHDMFKRNDGFHAGGCLGSATGYARGRMPDVLGWRPGFAAFMQYFRSKLRKNIYVMSGARPGSVTTSGNTSNHAAGDAVDVSSPGHIAGAAPSDPPPRAKRRCPASLHLALHPRLLRA